MAIIYPDYQPPSWIKGKHTETVFPSLFRVVKDVEYERERISTFDFDFLDIDWSRKGNKRLVILSHGLEGNSKQSYVLGMVKALNEAGWDTLSWNFRGCSGELNQSLKLYHAGTTEDLECVINYALTQYQYDEIALIGFSLGGIMILNYLGELGSKVPSKITKAIVFSVPCDLKSCAQELKKGVNRVYLNRFLITMKEKLIEKASQYPGAFDANAIAEVCDFESFDTLFTCPIFGFIDAADYYQTCSAKKAIPSITIPVVICNAQNDPFLNKDCYPIEECRNHPTVQLELPEYGGHLGFLADQFNKPFWTDLRAVKFLEK